MLSSWGSFLKSRQGVSLLLPACEGKGEYPLSALRLTAPSAEEAKRRSPFVEVRRILMWNPSTPSGYLPFQGRLLDGCAALGKAPLKGELAR